MIASNGNLLIIFFDDAKTPLNRVIRSDLTKYHKNINYDIFHRDYFFSFFIYYIVMKYEYY